MDEMVVQSYRILELLPGAPIDAVEKAFRDLSRVWDSDRLEGQPDLQQKAWDKQREMRWAYETLLRHATHTVAPEQGAFSARPAASYPPNVTSPAVSAEGEYAGFWLRVAAAILDGLVTGTGTYLVSMIWGFAIGLSGGGPIQAGVTGFMLGLAIPWLYSALMESSAKQATLGKMALGMVVTDLNGERISFGRATARYFAKCISGLILCIGFLMVAFTERKQGLHDKLADTLVRKTG